MKRNQDKPPSQKQKRSFGSAVLKYPLNDVWGFSSPVEAIVMGIRLRAVAGVGCAIYLG